MPDINPIPHQTPIPQPATPVLSQERALLPDEIILGYTEAQADTWYHANYQLNKDFTKATRKLVSQLLDDHRVLIVDVMTRVKKHASFIDKLKRKQQKYRTFSDCADICGCRIICVTSAQIEEVVSIIREQFKITEEFWREPAIDKFGYRSYHMMIELSDARKVLSEYSRFQSSKCELQIRTAFQEAWSALDHKVKYKPEAAADPVIIRDLQRVAALVELADKEWETIYNKT